VIQLLCTYQFLRLPTCGPPLPELQNYHIEQAQDALLDQAHQDAPVNLNMSDIGKLELTDEDNLLFAAINPGFDHEKFNEDGV
jgi:hypothetical protein